MTKTFRVHEIRAGWMADVAEMRGMFRVSGRLRDILGEMRMRDVREIAITGLTTIQHETLEALSVAAYRLENEIGGESADNERNSEAYRLGFL